MADQVDLHAHRPNEALGRANAPSSNTDAIAELAPLLGQSDPFADFGQRETRNPAVSPDCHAQHPRQHTHTLRHPSEQHADALNFDVRSYRGHGGGSDAYQTKGHAHYDGGNQGAYEHNEFGIKPEEIYYDQAHAPRRGRLTGVLVVALGLIGSAGAFGYRAMFHNWEFGTPAVVKTDIAQSKVAPAIQTNEQQSNQVIQDRVASSQPEAQASVAVNEPKKVRTVIFRPDQPDPSRPPAAVPNPPAQGTSGGARGSYVQVSSQRSETDAQASFKALQGKYPNVLGNKQAVIRRAELGNKGVYYRAMVGPFARVEQAAELCNSLKAAGARCILQRN